MDKLTQQINGKISTISKLRVRHPRKRQSKSEKNSQTLDLPTIRNTLGSFSPPLSKGNVTVVGSPQVPEKNSQEIDQIINGALMTYRNHKINKVIFASPLTGRNSMGRSYYRSSRFDTLDCPPGRYQSPRMTLKRPSDFNSLAIRIDKEHTFYGNEMLKLATTREERYNSHDNPLSMYNTSPKKMKENQAKLNRKHRIRQTPPHREIDDLCSPWIQLQEQEYLS